MKYLQGAINFFFSFILLISSEIAFSQTTSATTVKEIMTATRRLNWSSSCQQFVGTKGFGSWGAHIIRVLNRSEHPELYRASTDMKKTCPNFANLRDIEKEAVWVMVLAGVSFFESTCNKNAKSRGPNGIAQGLLQLHLDRESYYDSDCISGDSKHDRLSLSCGLSMLNSQLRRDQKLFSQNSYWEVLRPKSPSDKAKHIAWTLMFYKPCQLAK